MTELNSDLFVPYSNNLLLFIFTIQFSYCHVASETLSSPSVASPSAVKWGGGTFYSSFRRELIFFAALASHSAWPLCFFVVFLAIPTAQFNIALLKNAIEILLSIKHF